MLFLNSYYVYYYKSNKSSLCLLGVRRGLSCSRAIKGRYNDYNTWCSVLFRWSHVADKPLNCDRCSMSFTSKSQFALHIRTHSTGSCYECSVCGRSFVRDSYLIRYNTYIILIYLCTSCESRSLVLICFSAKLYGRRRQDSSVDYTPFDATALSYI